MKICIFLSSSPDLKEVYYKEAYEVGKKLAELNHEIIYGGGKKGLMGSLSLGALENNGSVIGIVPKFFDKPGIIEKNITKLIYTDSMAERKTLMENMADSFLCLPGGVGTFEELFEVITLKQLNKLNKPIGILNINGYFDHFINLMDKILKENFMSELGKDIYFVENDLERILNRMENEIKNPMDLAPIKNL